MSETSCAEPLAAQVSLVIQCPELIEVSGYSLVSLMAHEFGLASSGSDLLSILLANDPPSTNTWLGEGTSGSGSSTIGPRLSITDTRCPIPHI